MDIKKRYGKLIDLIILFVVISGVTLIIKYYFKPFIFMIIMWLISKPLYIGLLTFKIPKKVAGAASILVINIVIITLIIYMGSSIYELVNKVYENNLHIIGEFIKDIEDLLNSSDKSNFGKTVLNVIDKDLLKSSAITTSEMLIAYFLGNICTFFLLTDIEKIIDLVKRLIPSDIIKEIAYQKNNLRKVIFIELILVCMSMGEIIIGFIILRIPKALFLGVLCGILDILPYVGTIIVFIPIIIYNIIMKDYLIVFGLICLYLLVQVIREILEAKFLSDKLEIHPLLVLLSIYIGVKLFGMLGIVVGPMYGMLAKEVIYSRG